MNPLLYGLIVACIGLVVVFFGLILLSALINLMTAILNTKAAPAQKPSAPVVAAAPVAPVAPVEAEPVAAVQDDSEIVAAIMAAVNCMYEGTGKRPVVRAVRRSSANWKHAYM